MGCEAEAGVPWGVRPRAPWPWGPPSHGGGGRLDPRGNIRVVLQPEGRHELGAERRPIRARAGDHVGLVAADRARNLTEDLTVLDVRELGAQPHDNVGHLLARGGGRRRLSVRA